MRMTTARFIGIVLGTPVVLGAVLYAFGLRFEFDGTGSMPMFKWERGDRYADLDRKAAEDRAALAAVATPVPPAQVPAAVPQPANATVAEPVAMKAPWPSFYGPNRDGHYTETPILTAWPGSGLKQIWKRPVGGGYASMTVAGNRIYTIEQRRDKETVVSYDFSSGREVWADAWPGFFQESMGGDGPRATPTYDAGRVYALGAKGEFRCLDAVSGKVLWRKNILEDNGAPNLEWGMSASPLVVDGKVIVLPGGSGGRSIVAYDKNTGERIWGTLDDGAAYAAPMVATLAGQRQIVALTVTRAVGLSIEDGKLLWETPWVTSYGVNSALPIVVGPNRIVLTSGYGTGAKLLEITKQGDGFSAKELWTSQAIKAKFNNAVHHNGAIYGIDDGIMAAMDVATGKRLWKGGRYGFGQLLFAQGHLIVTSEQGEVVLVKASPERHEEVARFEAIDGKTWNVPAMADGVLLVRNTTEMAAYRVAP